MERRPYHFCNCLAIEVTPGRMQRKVLPVFNWGATSLLIELGICLGAQILLKILTKFLIEILRKFHV